MASNYLTTSVLSHGQRVRRLYKESLRALIAHYSLRHVYRYNACLLRERFDKNKDINDVREAKRILIAGEQELQTKAHPQPYKFPYSPGGVAHGRDMILPDWYLDIWHPLERAQYPEYFARREIRKKEFIERWEKQYGSS